MWRAVLISLFWAADLLLWTGLLLAIYIDISSCRMWTRRRRLGGGPSGIPVASLILYLFRVLVRPLDYLANKHRTWQFLVLLSLLAIAFHLTCQFILPRLVSRVHGSTRRGG
jgi:hypothetical protein